MYQRTVASECTFKGVGLHSDREVMLRVSPAKPHSGIVFVRTDTDRPVEVKARSQSVISTNLCTTIGERGNRRSYVSTVEHLMAAFWGLGVTNAYVELTACEVPIGDGSAAWFYQGLLRAGVSSQRGGWRKHYLCRSPLEVLSDDGQSLLRVDPYPYLAVECTIDFSARGSFIGKQHLLVEKPRENFTSLMDARTFCHFDDIKQMKRAGLALGGSLDSAVVVQQGGVINPEGLRYPDEFVRHKILDTLGDLALLDGDIVGKITLHKPGHTLNAKFGQSFARLRERHFDLFTSKTEPQVSVS